jgi:excisionase family DNA binding protein
VPKHIRPTAAGGKVMPRRPSPHRIKTHLIYTTWEAAQKLGCHKQTVIRWIKDKGLKADTSKRPWLIKGADLKQFLGDKRRSRKQKLALNQLYCLGCKVPRVPFENIADYVQNSSATGMLRGLCPECSALMNKVIRRSDLEAIRAKLDVTIQQALPRLVSRTDAPLNVTFTDKDHPHAKAHK